MAISVASSIPALLTEDVAVQAIRDFFRDKPFVFFGTGMSCALDARFGMSALTDHLSSTVKADSTNAEQVQQWQSVLDSLGRGDGLEAALNNVADIALLQAITAATGRFVAAVDRDYAFRIAHGNAAWPATRLFERLVASLPEGDRSLDVLTPNYDMLFEYACDSVGVPYTTGFAGGVERRKDWTAVDCSLRVRERVRHGSRSTVVCKHRKHVRIHKVHGSLNLFFHRNTVVENNAWMWDVPGACARVMITPGLAKYQTLQTFRQELLKSADAAIDKASHFLFLGYGFNDGHLEEYIKRKLVTQSCRGLVVTRDSNPRIEALLANAPNLWLVCKMQAASDEGTRIYNKNYPDWLVLPAVRLWDVGEFTKRIMGD